MCVQAIVCLPLRHGEGRDAGERDVGLECNVAALLEQDEAERAGRKGDADNGSVPATAAALVLALQDEAELSAGVKARLGVKVGRACLTGRNCRCD